MVGGRCCWSWKQSLLVSYIDRILSAITFNCVLPPLLYNYRHSPPILICKQKYKLTLTRVSDPSTPSPTHPPTPTPAPPAAPAPLGTVVLRGF